MSIRVSYDQTKQLMTINQGTLYALDSRLGTAAKNLGVAQAAVNDSTSDSEKEIMIRWQNLISNESSNFKILTDILRGKQNTLQDVYSQLEASINSNCGGLETLPIYTGDSSSL